MKHRKFKTIAYFTLLFTVYCFLFSILPNKVEAADASLYLVPSDDTYTVGNTFSVEVRVNSGDVAINAAEGTLVFDTNDLEVRSINKNSSVFSLWVQEPTFSNSLGTINFAGGKPSPGFTGATGRIMTIVFKAKSAGSANVTFASGSVLADDGKGTNILTNMGGGTYTLSARKITPVPPTEEKYIPPSAPGQIPAAPIVSSPTHPDENKWYPNSDPEFNWKLPSDVTGVSLLLNEKPTSNPGSISDGLIESKKYENIEDGEWYFHIKFKNENGWGEITHRKVLIDTKLPEPFQVVVDNENDPTNPIPIFLFETTDSLSGIEYYEVKLNEEKATTTPQNIKNNPYRPLPQPPGKYKLEVKAYDKAENYSSASTEFEISPIKGLEITKIPISIRTGETLSVEGKADPGITVRVYIQNLLEKEPILEKIKADSNGKFVLIYDKTLSKGDYVIWAQAEDERGALSEPTKKYDLEVGLPPFLKFGKIAIDYLTTIITLLVLILVLVLGVIWSWQKIKERRKKMRKEISEAEKALYQAFEILKEETEEQIAKLDGKPGLSEREKKICNDLKEALKISEKFIGKEIEDIEKELKL